MLQERRWDFWFSSLYLCFSEEIIRLCDIISFVIFCLNFSFCSSIVDA